jgi:hypothetical protein
MEIYNFYAQNKLQEKESYVREFETYSINNKCKIPFLTRFYQQKPLSSSSRDIFSENEFFDTNANNKHVQIPKSIVKNVNIDTWMVGVEYKKINDLKIAASLPFKEGDLELSKIGMDFVMGIIQKYHKQKMAYYFKTCKDFVDKVASEDYLLEVTALDDARDLFIIANKADYNKKVINPFNKPVTIYQEFWMVNLSRIFNGNSLS